MNKCQRPDSRVKSLKRVAPDNQTASAAASGKSANKKVLRDLAVSLEKLPVEYEPASSKTSGRRTNTLRDLLVEELRRVRSQDCKPPRLLSLHGRMACLICQVQILFPLNTPEVPISPDVVFGFYACAEEQLISK